MLRISAAALVASLLAVGSAAAQQNTALTEPGPVTIAAGNTYQQLLPLITPSAGTPRRSLTIQNNNASDACYITVGGPNASGNTTSTLLTINGVTLSAAKASILLLPGAIYARYYPFVPPDQVLGTCPTTGDSLYVDTQ